MQLATFMNGGFVAHKVTLGGVTSVYTVWYDATGFMTAAARQDRLGRVYDLPLGSPMGDFVAQRTRYLVTPERCPLMPQKAAA